ncbi:MAG: hypothetical protein AAF530_19140 [Pseudomonadota bacterium]
MEVVNSYKAGALRSSILGIWIAVVFDLISKYRELAGLGDHAATKFVQSWDNATKHNNVQKLLELEKNILTDASNNTQIIDKFAESQLKRLMDDRNFCAHPAFSSEAELFEPSPELTRLHLVNAIEFVLAQAPLQGKAMLGQFDIDLRSSGFPGTYEKVQVYVAEKYLIRFRSGITKNFGVVLAKSLLRGIPKDWISCREKVIWSLIAVREKSSNHWPEVSAHIVRLIDDSPPEHRLRAVSFLTIFPDFLELLQESTITALKETIENSSQEPALDLQILKAARLPGFREPILKFVEKLPDEQLRDMIRVAPMMELWQRALKVFSDSGSYRGSEQNFRDLILPYAGKLKSRQLDDLLQAISGNNQIWDASETAALLASLLEATKPEDFPSHQARYDFTFRSDAAYLVRRHYVEVTELFKRDGWQMEYIPEDPEE